MRTRRRLLGLAAALVIGALALPPVRAEAGAPPTTFSGTFNDGVGTVKYLIQAPASWNGTVVLYSHGYVVPGSSNPAEDVGDPITGAWLLNNGYALAGSSYSTTGWALQQALPDQIHTLGLFKTLVGQPTRTIAWGHSLGGIITAGLIQQYPGTFDAALPMCGVLSGGVGTWNEALDSAFAVQQLLGQGTGLQVVNITNPTANLGLAEAIGAAAQATPQGRARVALSAALGDTPGWFTPLSTEPSPTDYAAQELNQYQWGAQVDYPFAFALRAELEARAGGNPSWNTGVNYEDQLEKSPSLAEVRALYKAAGLNLNADLKTLNAAPRVSNKPSSTEYLENNITFNGDLDIPVLTMHTTGDGLVVNQNEQAYRDAVGEAGDNSLLRQTFVHRAGHCAFTPAETITAFQTLIGRLNSGHWNDSTDANLMNTEASALGPGANLF
jgi:dienelactone hydrolase